MKLVYLFIINSCLLCTLQAQEYTLPQLEAQFLQNNAALIANRLQISRAEAKIVQEKLWTNPTLSIAEVNLWKTYNIEEQPTLFGKYGKSQQISVELEQLIETAGKRKKRVSLKVLEKEEATFVYEELLRELRKDLRLAFHSLKRIQQQEIQLRNMLLLFQQMNDHYQRQANLQHIAKADFFRIQSELIALQNQQITLENEKFDDLNTLRLLTHQPDLDVSQLRFDPILPTLSARIPLAIQEIAKTENSALKRQLNAVNQAHNQLRIEKAQRVPDLRVQINYDRGGNIMTDFMGFGVSFDLPVLNRNIGNIHAAQIQIEQQKTNQIGLELTVEQTLDKLQKQLIRYENLLKNWPNATIAEQQEMVENYKKHLHNNKVTLIEFIDFTQAYLNAQEASLLLQEKYSNTWEEIQNLVGKDL